MSKIGCIQDGIVMIGSKADGRPVDLIGCTGESKQDVAFLCVLYEFAPMLVFVYIGVLDDIGWRESELLERVSYLLRVFYHLLIATVQLSSRLFHQ